MSGCLPLSKYWLQKEGKGLWAILEPEEAYSIFITEALDVLSGKLKREKKTPKRVFASSSTSRAVPSGGHISVLAAKYSNCWDGDLGLCCFAWCECRCDSVDSYCLFIIRNLGVQPSILMDDQLLVNSVLKSPVMLEVT